LFFPTHRGESVKRAVGGSIQELSRVESQSNHSLDGGGAWTSVTSSLPTSKIRKITGGKVFTRGGTRAAEAVSRGSGLTCLDFWLLGGGTGDQSEEGLPLAQKDWVTCNGGVAVEGEAPMKKRGILVWDQRTFRPLCRGPHESRGGESEG